MFNRILGGGSPLPVAVVQSVEYKTSDFNHRFCTAKLILYI